MNYINPYSDAFTQRLIRAKEKRDRLKEADAHDIVLARRNSGLQFSTSSSDSSCLHSSMKTFVARPLSVTKTRNNSTFFQDEEEVSTRSRSATTTSRYKDGERNVFEHLANLAKKNDKKISTTPLPTARTSISELKPWIPNGKKQITNTNKKGNEIIKNNKKSKDLKLMNDLYVYTNSKSNQHQAISTPISNYRYNDEYSFTNFNNNEKSVKDTVSEISVNIQNADSKIHKHKSLISQQSLSISSKKPSKERSRVALSGYLIDKSSAVEACRQGILLVSRGSTSEELILSIRQQFGCNNISDVIVNYKNKATQNITSRSYSMDKLEEMPQIDENCDFIAYIGGAAIIDTSGESVIETNEYDYIGLRDRLSKKLHSFSISSPTNINKKTDSLSVFTFDINQHSQNDDVVSTSHLIVSKMKSTSAPPISNEHPNFRSTTSVNNKSVISSSLEKKNLSSVVNEKHQSKKALVESLLSSNKKQETKSSLSNLFPYGSSDNDGKSRTIDNGTTEKCNKAIDKGAIDKDTIDKTADKIFDNITVKPRIKFQIDLSSLLED